MCISFGVAISSRPSATAPFDTRKKKWFGSPRPSRVADKILRHIGLGSSTHLLCVSGVVDLFVQKLNSNGDFVWARTVGGQDDDAGSSCALDSIGNVYTAGSFEDTLDFDPGPGTYTLNRQGFFDAFVLKLSGPPDTTPPNVVGIDTVTTGPTKANGIVFTVIFDEAVQNFNDASDLVINHSGTANASVGISGGPLVYTVVVGGISGDGAFTLAVSTNSDVTDLAGNALASSVTSAAVYIQNAVPKDNVPLLAWPLALALLGAGSAVLRRRTR